MSLPHRGLKLCPYSKALLQGLSIDPKSKAPDKHSQFEDIFSFVQIYIYKKLVQKSENCFTKILPITMYMAKFDPG